MIHSVPKVRDNHLQGYRQIQVLAQEPIYSFPIIKNNLKSSLIHSFSHEVMGHCLVVMSLETFFQCSLLLFFFKFAASRLDSKNN